MAAEKEVEMEVERWEVVLREKHPGTMVVECAEAATAAEGTVEAMGEGAMGEDQTVGPAVVRAATVALEAAVMEAAGPLLAEPQRPHRSCSARRACAARRTRWQRAAACRCRGCGLYRSTTGRARASVYWRERVVARFGRRMQRSITACARRWVQSDRSSCGIK